MNVDEKKVKNTIIALKKANKRHNILLVDDLFESGETLNECTRVLKQDELLNKIYVLAMTKTKDLK
ncbi:MAG: hypothetical protein M0R46_14740 [Candidatus Muirbacterium halophilum]|nr:hypothetical protein [Candidatus Muirbacterium halophilum]